MVMPTCGCTYTILRNPDGFQVDWCPLHAAAEETAKQRDQLLEAATWVVPYIRGMRARGMMEIPDLAVQALVDAVAAAFATAQPEKQGDFFCTHPSHSADGCSSPVCTGPNPEEE